MMNKLFKTLSVPVLSVFLVGGAFACAEAAQQPQMNQNQQQSKSSEQPNVQQQQPQSNMQQPQQQPNAQQQPQTKAQQRKMQSVTGKVTVGGGLIAQNGEKFRLEGAKAAGLRSYTNRTVTIKGYKTNFEGHNAIEVQSFQAGQANMAQNNEQPRSHSNFRSREQQGMQPAHPGQTGYRPNQNQQQPGQPTR